MNLNLLLILLFISSISFGQFAIVKDKDSTLNVRKDGSKKSAVIDQL